MGKASRHKRVQRETNKHAVAAELAARAEGASAVVVRSVEEGISALRTDHQQARIDMGRWALARQRTLDKGGIWPSWSWLPSSMVMAQLDLAMQGLLVPGLTDEDLNPYVALLMPVVNWLPRPAYRDARRRLCRQPGPLPLPPA